MCSIWNVTGMLRAELSWKVQLVGIQGMCAGLKISGYFGSHLLDSCLPTAAAQSQIPDADAVIGV